MKKKPSYNKDSSENREAREPVEEYTPKKRLKFEAHQTFEEMNDAKRAAFMALSPAERFQKGLELYTMFKEHTNKQPDPDSFVLRKRDKK